MTINEKDAELVISVSKVLGVELDPWQEYVLRLMFADHRQANHDDSDTAIPTCRRWSLTTGEWCVLEEGHPENDPFPHQTSRGRNFSLCNAGSGQGTRCSLEPHSDDVQHSAGAYQW